MWKSVSVLRGGRSPGSDRDDVFDLRRFSSEGREDDLVAIAKEDIREATAPSELPIIVTGKNARRGFWRARGSGYSCCQEMKQETEVEETREPRELYVGSW